MVALSAKSKPGLQRDPRKKRNPSAAVLRDGLLMELTHQAQPRRAADAAYVPQRTPVLAGASSAASSFQRNHSCGSIVHLLFSHRIAIAEASPTARSRVWCGSGIVETP